MSRQHAIALIKIAAQRAEIDFNSFDKMKLERAIELLMDGLFPLPMSLTCAMG